MEVREISETVRVETKEEQELIRQRREGTAFQTEESTCKDLGWKGT